MVVTYVYVQVVYYLNVLCSLFIRLGHPSRMLLQQWIWLCGLVFLDEQGYGLGAGLWRIWALLCFLVQLCAWLVAVLGDMDVSVAFLNFGAGSSHIDFFWFLQCGDWCRWWRGYGGLRTDMRCRLSIFVSLWALMSGGLFFNTCWTVPFSWPFLHTFCWWHLYLHVWKSGSSGNSWVEALSGKHCQFALGLQMLQIWSGCRGC